MPVHSRFPLTRVSQYPLVADRVYMEAYPSSVRLQSRGKGRQLARANSTTLLDRATPTWTADQIIVVYFDGSNEKVWFVRTEDEFDDLQGNPDWVGDGVSGSPGDITVRTVNFLKFAGAVNLAGYRG